MPLHNHITDPTTGQEAAVHKPNNLAFENPGGLVAYTEPRKIFEPHIQFFQADSGAIDMNIDASGGGTPENIHDGGDTAYWTASALSGTWDFASTTQANGGLQSVDATATTNGDEALFEDATNIDMSVYVSLSGFIYIDSWSAVGTKEVEIRARLAGVDVGNPVNLSDYIDTGVTGSWQGFLIPKADLGLSGQTVDELVVKTIDTGGQPAPDYYLDDLLWTGVSAADPVTYYIRNLTGRNTLMSGMSLFMADVVTEAAALAYNTFLAVPALTNGFQLTRQTRGEIATSISLKQLSDVIQTYGEFRIDTGGDATNRWLKIEFTFDPPVRLNEDDFMSMTVQDDVSGLLMLRGSVRALIEVPNE